MSTLDMENMKDMIKEWNSKGLIAPFSMGMIAHPFTKSIVDAALKEREQPPPIVIYESPMLFKTVQLKHPRSNKNKRRITKKFAKKYSIKVPSNEVIMFDTSSLSINIKGLL